MDIFIVVRVMVILFLIFMTLLFIAMKPKQRKRMSKYMLMLIGIGGLCVAPMLHYDIFYRPKVGPLGSRVITQDYINSMIGLVGISAMALLSGSILFFMERKKFGS